MHIKAQMEGMTLPQRLVQLQRTVDTFWTATDRLLDRAHTLGLWTGERAEQPRQGFSVMPQADEGGKPLLRLLDEDPKEGTPAYDLLVPLTKIYRCQECSAEGKSYNKGFCPQCRRFGR